MDVPAPFLLIRFTRWIAGTGHPPSVPLQKENTELGRSVVSKVIWVGRATVFLVGLSVILAVIFGVASTALGADGEPFLLGKRNVAPSVSKLVKRGWDRR